MTLQEKVGQLMMVSFQGEEINQDATALVQELKVGGILYYSWANGLKDPEKVRRLGENLQAMATIPLLIAIDQEGGRVQRLGYKNYPSNQEGCENAGEIAYAMGKELKELAINMNLAPVIDVNSQPLNPVIGDRCYSSDPLEVASCGKKALDGYKKAGVIATVKHFPGHGDTVIDSHEEMPILNKTVPELEKTELIPFRALSQDADAMMTGHLLVPSLDAENLTTFSKKSLDFLRNEIGFNGVIVSDSLVMGAVLKNTGSLEEGAICAINAGCDLLIFGGSKLNGEDRCLSPLELRKIQEAIEQAVLSEKISIKRIDDAFERVLRLKQPL